MTAVAFVSPDEIRANFSSAMSDMYRAEVPLYGNLIQIVEDVNTHAMRADAALRSQLEARDEIERLAAERHGAIRVGTPAELSLLRRAFAVMGMHPVGYYDLAVAGVPVHSTAFRPIESKSLARNPFRVFTSLLRPELIADVELRASAEAILASRRIVSDEAIRLIEAAEANGGLSVLEGESFVSEMLETFQWHGDALVDVATYDRLHASHRLVADVVSFRGPHINHLTLRTLDIDEAQHEMANRGIDAKAVIEGPPPRRVPILLRQTSFKALEERVRFTGQSAEESGTHTARFGEIEQRGIALTPKGRALYDILLEEARDNDVLQGPDYPSRLAQVFDKFPDDEAELRTQGLAYFRYRVLQMGGPVTDDMDMDALVAAGRVGTEPIVYEDFLPVSAAGIFQSNLGGEEQRIYEARVAQAEFEAALGASVYDPFNLYEEMQAASKAAVRAALRGEAWAVD